MTRVKRRPTAWLCEVFNDPKLRDAFRRAERHRGQAFAVPADHPKELYGGPVEAVLVAS